MGVSAAFPAVTAAALLVLLTGCSLTPESLQSEPDAASQDYGENYETVFRRLTDTSRRCLMSNNTVGSAMDVDAELHRDLGYGQVRFVAVSIGIRGNYFVSAKIEKLRTGSRVSVKTNNPLISRGLTNIVFRWSGGDTTC